MTTRSVSWGSDGASAGGRKRAFVPEVEPAVEFALQVGVDRSEFLVLAGGEVDESEPGPAAVPHVAGGEHAPDPDVQPDGEPENQVEERRLALALLAGDDEDRCPVAHLGSPPMLRTGWEGADISRPGSVGDRGTLAPEYMDIHLRCSYKIILLNNFV
jgi:hypothetical protein